MAAINGNSSMAWIYYAYKQTLSTPLGKEYFKMADFAEKLGKAMGEISQAELARRSGVSQQNIHKYLARKTKASWEHVQALSAALGVSCESLRDDEPVIKPDADAPPPKPRGRPKKI